ncbi:MAG: L,D-transpeptidase family protein, partial [Bdellovibrionales bacterium]|nr:L,D-transpeptidase family protein [Bdellovibrionales bacterium]
MASSEFQFYCQTIGHPKPLGLTLEAWMILIVLMPHKNKTHTAILTTLFILIAVSFWNNVSYAQEDPAAITPPKGLVPENFILVDSSVSHPKNIFIADKENRTLTVWSHTANAPQLVGAYPMDIGKNQGDKVASGDQKTPEGIYFFQEKLEGPTLNFNEYGKRAFTLDYPNFFDQLAGKTGNGIWLHSVPETKTLLRGSRGCVVVRNEIIEKLTPLISLKNTPMLILDRVNYVKPEILLSSRSSLQNWIESWKTAWESKNIDTYMSHYQDNFKALRMNKKTWRRYKEGLNQKYSYIKVTVREPFFVMKEHEAVINFIQDYDSDGKKDLGTKTLYVKKDNEGQFKILTEVWA